MVTPPYVMPVVPTCRSSAALSKNLYPAAAACEAIVLLMSLTRRRMTAPSVGVRTTPGVIAPVCGLMFRLSGRGLLQLACLGSLGEDGARNPVPGLE